MIEKILHGGNFAACFGAIATTAADLGICGGTATGISALLSAHAVIKRDKNLTPLAHQMGQAFEAAVKASPLPADTKKLIPQLMAKFPVSEEDIAKGILEPAQVAAIIRARIENAREKGTEDPALTGAALVKAYEAILTQMLTPVLAAPVGMEPMQWAINRQMLAQSAITGATKRLFEEGVTEKAIIGLAQKIAAETNDIGQAWTELQNAMEMAVRVQADGRVASNHGDFVDVVLHRVAALSADGEYKSAGDEIDAALAREEEEAQARRVKLLERGVEVALLDRDTKRAAELMVRKADLGAGGVAGFGDLRTLQDFYFERGRDKGINLDLELAIDLAELIKARADSTDELGTASNDLGLALGILGERESGTVRLKAAVKAYEAAMEEWAKDTLPFEWAMTQNNLGLALQSLGERESGTARLEEAVEAYGAALEEWTRDKVPLEWAATQNNLGNALYALGERESGTARLEEAVEAFEAALEEWTRDEAPLQWATTQNNLGNALAALGQRESGTARLEAAAEAYRAAREEQTRKRVPLDWAKTQNNLASLEIAFFDKTGAADHLNRAEAHVNAAREVFLDNGAEHHVGITDEVIAAIQERRSGA